MIYFILILIRIALGHIYFHDSIDIIDKNILFRCEFITSDIYSIHMHYRL